MSDDNSEEEQAKVALMACIKASDDRTQSELGSEFESDSEELFAKLSHYELQSCLSEILEKYQKLHNKYKDLKQVQVYESKAHSKLKKVSPL